MECNDRSLQTHGRGREGIKLFNQMQITAESKPANVTLMVVLIGMVAQSASLSMMGVPNVSVTDCKAIFFMAQEYEDAVLDSSLLTFYLMSIFSASLLAADRMKVLFLQVLAYRWSTVHEEAMHAIGSLAFATRANFLKYMQEHPYLEMGLHNFEYQIFAITVGVVGDLCRALETKVLPLCDGAMTHLLKDLSSIQHPRSVKPPIYSCFGDLALAMDEKFKKYLGCTMPILLVAASKVISTFLLVFVAEWG